MRVATPDDYRRWRGQLHALQHSKRDALWVRELSNLLSDIEANCPDNNVILNARLAYGHARAFRDAGLKDEKQREYERATRYLGSLDTALGMHLIEKP